MTERGQAEGLITVIQVESLQTKSIKNSKMDQNPNENCQEKKKNVSIIISVQLLLFNIDRRKR